MSIACIEGVENVKAINICCEFYRLDSSVGRASAFRVGGRGFESRPHHTKGVKNGTSSSLADARIKLVVLGR